MPYCKMFAEHCNTGILINDIFQNINSPFNHWQEMSILSVFCEAFYDDCTSFFLSKKTMSFDAKLPPLGRRHLNVDA